MREGVSACHDDTAVGTLTYWRPVAVGHEQLVAGGDYCGGVPGPRDETGDVTGGQVDHGHVVAAGVDDVEGAAVAAERQRVGVAPTWAPRYTATLIVCFTVCDTVSRVGACGAK